MDNFMDVPTNAWSPDNNSLIETLTVQFVKGQDYTFVLPVKPASVLDVARSGFKLGYGTAWADSMLTSAMTYLEQGILRDRALSAKSLGTVAYFDDSEKVKCGDKQAQEILNNLFMDALAGSPQEDVLNNANHYLNGVYHAYATTHGSQYWDGDSAVEVVFCGDAAAAVVLDTHFNEMHNGAVKDILSNALSHITGYNIADYDHKSKAWDGDVTVLMPSEPANIQLGMLGRKDGELSKKEAQLVAFEEEITWRKCCDGEGKHDYDEDLGPDCQCCVLGCGCVCYGDGGNDVYECSNCESCEGCCIDCSSCGSCGERVSNNSYCDKCSRCDACCSKKGECWTCGSCNKPQSNLDDNYGCGVCNYCEGCCECMYCENCAEPHSSDTKWCSDCNSCLESCECEGTCANCGGTNKPYKLCAKCASCGDCCTGHSTKAKVKVSDSNVVPGCNCYQCTQQREGVTAALSTAATTVMQPKTQKAKGLLTLKNYLGAYLPPFTVVKAAGLDSKLLTGRFVRPCPMTPRHGFVDSRFVDTEELAATVLADTLAADPEAEFILMYEIKCTHSGVWTPGIMVIGPKNDGATAGKDSVTIPIAGDMLKFTNDTNVAGLLNEAGIKSAPYAELLWTKRQNARKQEVTPIYNIVQLRDGPVLPQQIDYIEAEMTVANVIVAEGDLLEWETKMKNQPAGTVVAHPGGSLASHYAVHAVLNHVPVMISKVPVVGDVLVPTQDGEAKVDMDAIRRGFFYALTAHTDYKSATYMMLMGCHSTATWIGKQDTLLGAALGFTYRLAVTAAVGEWRHRPSQHPKKSEKVSREYMYQSVWNRMVRSRGVFMRALRHFRTQDWSESMGGEQWFQFTRWAAVILNNVIAGDFTGALSAMNNTVHAVHNGGWGFNKFAEANAMDVIAANPVGAMQYCAPVVYDILTTNVEADTVRYFNRTKRLPIELADTWLKSVTCNRETATFGQAMIEGDKLIVQYKRVWNSAVVGTEKLTIPPDRMSIVNEYVDNILDCGRCMKTFQSNADGTFDKSATIMEGGERVWAQLHKNNSLDWKLVSSNGKAISIHHDRMLTDEEIYSEAMVKVNADALALTAATKAAAAALAKTPDEVDGITQGEVDGITASADNEAKLIAIQVQQLITTNQLDAYAKFVPVETL